MAALASVVGALLCAIALPVAAQVRDPVPASGRGASTAPVERRIPVGNASISGVVVTADTGRPIAGARVSLTGAASVAEGLFPSGPPAVTASGRGGATVTLSNGATVNMASVSTGVQRTVTTDAQGTFSFPKLPGGVFTLSVQRNQFLFTNYGQKRYSGPGAPIQVVDGQSLKLTIPMTRGSVIAGTVLSDNGEPMPNVFVNASRFMYVNGVKQLSGMGGAQTDDRGVYRIHGLQPGDYIVGATNNSGFMMDPGSQAELDAVEQAIATGAVQPPAAPGLPSTVAVTIPQRTPGQSEPSPGYLPTYYGGTTNRQSAAIVHVNGADEHNGIDIQIQLVRATAIVGTVVMPPTDGVTVQVALISDDPTVQGSQSNLVMQDGKFRFQNVVPGNYTLLAQTIPRPGQTMPTFFNGAPAPMQQQPYTQPRLTDDQKLWARASVVANGEMSVGGTLIMQKGKSLSGIVQFDMAQPPSDLTRTTVMLSPVSGSNIPMYGGPIQANLTADGRFTINGVTPGRYTVRASSGFMRSAMLEGQDILDSALEIPGERDVTDLVITVIDKLNELSGVLSDASGKPAAAYTIIAASTDPKFWTPGSRRIAMTRTSFDGRYTFRSLPPGEYLLAALTDLEQGAQFDPEFLKSLTFGTTRVSIMEGTKTTQDLRVAIK